MRKIENEYFDWLIGLINHPLSRSELYSLVLHRMYTTPFIWLIANDENRVADGLKLRETFVEEQYGNSFNYIYNRLERPCSVLEVLIGLAKRCEEDIMQDPLEGDRTSLWFWIMMGNLGLDVYEDYNFDKDEVDYILDRFMKRTYQRNGKHGGIFYTNVNNKDYRKTELWYQLCWYLDEHYSNQFLVKNYI